jgi:hypothetical protein
MGRLPGAGWAKHDGARANANKSENLMARMEIFLSARKNSGMCAKEKFTPD